MVYDLRCNEEHYPDPTAYEAIVRADAQLEYERHKKLIGCLLRVCELADFEVIERISVRDKRTGKVWW
jgi:hypothetical protein